MTPWQKEMLIVLANHVRTLSLLQVARTWWAGQSRSVRNARESLQGLAKGGWLKIHDVFARPVSPLSQPQLVWTVGQPVPQLAELAKWLHKRARAAAQMTTVVTATPRTHALFGQGGGARGIKLTQMTHDLHLGEVFLIYRREGLEGRWVGEDSLPHSWPIPQRPDAVLLDQGGNFLRAVEYGGDYPVERLTALHHALASMGLSYEIW